MHFINSVRVLPRGQKCSVLLQPLFSTVQLQKRNILYKKKFDLKEKYNLILYQRYDLSVKGMKDMLLRKTQGEIYNRQIYDVTKVEKIGPDLTAAALILSLKGQVKFCHDHRWVKATEDGRLPIPIAQKRGFYLEGIDLSNSQIMLPGLEYLYGLEMLRYLNLSGAKNVTDWYIQRVVELCPDLEYLDLSGCKRITSASLDSVHALVNLKVLDITGCDGIKEAEVASDLLLEFVPELEVIGVTSCQPLEGSLHEHEYRSSRYLSMGEPIPDTYIQPSLPYRLGTYPKISDSSSAKSEDSELCDKN